MKLYRLYPPLFFALALLGGLAVARAQVITDTIHAPTYSAATVANTMAATATDVFCLKGSDTKMVTVHNMQMTGISTTANTTDLTIIRRSTASTGAFTTITPAQMDPADPAPTAVAYVYAANPSVLGTSAGLVHADKYTFTAATGAPANTILPYTFANRYSKDLILRGSTQSVCFNMNGITPAGTVFSGDIYWTEQ